MIAIMIVLGVCIVYTVGYALGYKLGKIAGEEEVLDEVNEYFAKQIHQKGTHK